MAQQTLEYKVKIDSGNSVKTLGQLEEELAGINEELKDVEIGSDRFKELSKSAQDATRSIEEINSEIAGITGEDKIRGLDGAVKILGGSVSGLVGGLGLLGVESETFGKFEEAAASAIAFGIGIKDVSEGIGQLGPLFKKSGIAAKLFGITTKQALIATGIGIFAVALGGIIAYWDDIVKGIEKFGEKVPFVGKAIQALKDGFNSVVEFFRPVLEFLGIMPTEAEKANNAVIASNEALLESGQRELALLQARGAKAEEIFAQREKMLKAELDNLRRTDAEKEAIYQKETELLALQAAEEKRIQDERDAARKKREDERKAEQQKKEEEAKAQKEKEEQAEKDRLQSLEDIRKEYEKRAEDDAAETEVQRLELEQQRKLKELEDLQATEEQKLQIINYYKNLIKEAEAEEKLALDEKKKEEDEAELERIAEQEQAKLDIKKESLQTLSELFGQETALGKAALIAKQALLLQELIGEAKGLSFKAKNVATEATLDGAKAGSNIAVGASETAKVGFPQNIPLLIGYAAQAAAIFSTVKQAVSKTTALAGIGSAPTLPSLSGAASVASTPTAATPTQEQIELQTAQEQRQGQQPVRAYVLQGDIANSTEAANKLRQRRTVGQV